MVLYTFYKIYCKDPCIVDSYVGRTINFSERKVQHINNFSRNVKNKLYDFIRFHGGFSNWCIEKLCEVDCSSLAYAALHEMYWYLKSNSTLNTYIPGINYYKRSYNVPHLYNKRKEVIDNITELFQNHHRFSEVLTYTSIRRCNLFGNNSHEGTSRTIQILL
jgi:hypothetical protein